jgi:ssDNA-binding Zn-finger/Zn-ribbon topoisomerase 1
MPQLPSRRPFRVGRSRTGLGIFATKPIKKKQWLAEYRGKLITAKQADSYESRYQFEVNSRWTIEGATRNNLARYFNHSCRPNAEVEIYGHRVFIRARKAIEPGEEITYDYGTDYFKAFLGKDVCQCPKCREYRKAERAERRKAAKRRQARANKRKAATRSVTKASAAKRAKRDKPKRAGKTKRRAAS